MSSVVIKMEHCRSVGYCARGVRALCDRYGLDYSKFLREGLDAQQVLEATGNDAMVVAAVQVAELEADRG